MWNGLPDLDKEMNLPSVTVNDVTLNVFDQGTGHPILFVHGYPLTHAMWQPQLDALSDTFRVIAPDLRGFGQSGVTEGTVTMQQHADDMNALLDALGVDVPITYCGLSLGGYIGWRFVKSYGHRLHSLIMCNTRVEADSAEEAARRMKVIDALLAGGIEIIAEMFIPMMFSKVIVDEQPEMVEQVKKTIAKTNVQGMIAGLRGMAERPDSTDVLDLIKVPTLFIVGSKDTLSSPADMRQMAETVGGAEFLEIPIVGHVTPMEDPQAVNNAIRHFLNGQAPH